MKKILLSLFVLLAAFGVARAEEVTLTTNATASTWTGDANGYVSVIGNFEVSYLKANSTSNCVAPSEDHIRVYKNADFKITGLNGETITKLVLNVVTANHAVDMTPNTGVVVPDAAAKTITWTGSATTVTLSATVAQVRIMSVEVTYEAQSGSVPAPTFDPAPGTSYGEHHISIACSNEEADIYYTIDGTDPTLESTKYTAPFEITATTTVKALANAGEDFSSVVSATYTIVETTAVASIAEFLATATGTVVKFTCPLHVAYQNTSANGNNYYLYVVDGEGGATQIFGNTGKTYANGDVIPAGVIGTRAVYRQTAQLGSPVQSSFEAGTAGAAVTPESAHCNEIGDGLVNFYVTITDVTIDATATTITDDYGTLAYYNRFANVEIPTGTGKYDVTGIINNNDGTLQIYPTEFKEATGTGLRDLNNASVIITTDYSAIHINSAENAAVSVINTLGQSIVNTKVSAGATMLNVPAGLYIVKVNDTVTKVLVK